MNTPIQWHDDQVVFGIRVRPYFFDSHEVEAKRTLVERALPFLNLQPPVVLHSEKEGKNFEAGLIIAQSDGVFQHGKGLISLEYKRGGDRKHSREHWRRDIKLRNMLQCLIAGHAVARCYRRPTACVLRYRNVCYFLVPQPGVMEKVIGLAAVAKDFYEENRRVNSSQLAELAEVRLRQAYAPLDEESARLGQEAHARLLRTD